MRRKYFTWEEMSEAQKENQRRYVTRDGGVRNNLSSRISAELKKPNPNQRKLSDMRRAFELCQEIFGVYKPRARVNQ